MGTLFCDRMKRGRGAVGSRMDEPGPYPACAPSSPSEKLLPSHEVRPLDEPRRRVLGPEKPASFLSLRKQLKEASSSSRRDSTKVDDDSQSKRRRRRRHSEEVECRTEESRDRRKKDKKRRHRRRSQ